MRKPLAILFLVWQLGMLVYARFSPDRYFTWAPFDSRSEYDISVALSGRTLESQEILDRYGIKAHNVNPRAIQHIKNIIQQYETTYGRLEGAQVVLTYDTNGISQPTWTWPQ